MLEKFTPEEIEQLRQELKFRDRSSQKSILIERDLRRIEKAFDRNLYSPMELYPAYEIKGALTTIVDHATGNYALKVKPTHKKPNPHYTRNVTVPAAIADVYAELVRRIVDAVIELKLPMDIAQIPKVGDSEC